MNCCHDGCRLHAMLDGLCVWHHRQAQRNAHALARVFNRAPDPVTQSEAPVRFKSPAASLRRTVKPRRMIIKVLKPKPREQVSSHNCQPSKAERQHGKPVRPLDAPVTGMNDPSCFDPVEAERSRKLWLNVLYQAVADAIEPRMIHLRACHQPKGEGRDRYMHGVKRKARAWFSLSNRDFILTCDLAGMDPAFIHDRTLQAIKNHDALGRLINGYRGCLETLPPAMGTGPGRREKPFDGADLVPEALQ